MATTDSKQRHAQSAITPNDFTDAVAAVTQALGDPTRRAIYLYVREQADGVTVNQVADYVELHPNVARHHLEKLVAGGYVNIDTTSQEGERTPGRPSKLYRASSTEPSFVIPPRQDGLLAALLERAIAMLNPADAATMADEVGYLYGRQLAQNMAVAGNDPLDTKRSLRAAMDAVAEALTAHGFAAHTEGRGKTLTIINEHCPFGEAATRYPDVLCSVDRGMIRGMMAELYGETQPAFAESLPEGNTHCVAHV